LNGNTREYLGHPKGLFVLFFTEMWERFSYYGMRALLMLYMVNYFKFTQEHASSIYKWYTSLVYLTPLLGGYLADRYLGNKRAIIIGSILMAIGHFCMAFEQIPVFYAALAFLIIGNGFFKPNMSAQVGRLYPANDPRRDSAYTIFYMGINLGAFLSPIICGWLRLNTKWEYHAGFAAAGIGMVLGLIVYIWGLKLVEEVAEEPAPGPQDETDREIQEKRSEQYMTEKEAATAPSVVPFLAEYAPALIAILGILAGVAAIVLWLLGVIPGDTAIGLGLGGGFSSAMGVYITSHVSMALRDRVLAIFAIAIFVVFFWAAFEQAGNAMNVFADKTTDRYLTKEAPTPSVYPEIKEDEEGTFDWSVLGARAVTGINLTSGSWWSSSRPIVIVVMAIVLWWLLYYMPKRGHRLAPLTNVLFVFIIVVGMVFPLMVWPITIDGLRGAFNPVSTEWFQSINAAAIFIMAPVFAWLWVWLPRKGIALSIPAKVMIGVFMQAVAFALMMWSIAYENQPSSAPLRELPRNVVALEDESIYFRDAPDLDAEEAFEKNDDPIAPDEELSVVQGGRIKFDGLNGELDMNGVLSDIDRDRLLRATAPVSFMKKVKELADRTAEAADQEGEDFSASVTLDEIPPGFDLRYAGFPEDKLSFDKETKTLTAKVELADKDYISILVAGSDPEFRAALNDLYIESAAFKVGASWLFWFYILCTIGELCLSPVGLSMVSKLAPARFATMLMGMWLLTSFFGNFFAGLAGELYGKYHPTTYFGMVALIVGGASVICFFCIKKIKSMMHGVV